MMQSAGPPHRRLTFISRAILSYRDHLKSGINAAAKWRSRAADWAKNTLTELNRSALENTLPTIAVLAVITWLGLTIWFVLEWASGKVEGNAVQTGVGGLVASAVVALIASPIIAIALYLAIVLLIKVAAFLAPVLFLAPFLLLSAAVAIWHAAILAAKLLLLIPLGPLALSSRMIQLWRGIFYTCPSRSCTHRGLPGYDCSKCGSVNTNLWPDLYGVLYHECANCNDLLPTLDRLGRKNLKRRCGGCGMPLMGRHAGLAPERLVAIAGSPDSGKTSWLWSTVAEIRKGTSDIRAEIDDPAQEQEFREEWDRIQKGLRPAKTAGVASAFILHGEVAGKKCQIYLYDAPGEEFGTIGSMTKQQYLPLLEGVIFLVDPFEFSVTKKNSVTRNTNASFETVVNNTIAGLRSSQNFLAHSQTKMRAAVVLSKAELLGIRKQVGDIRISPIPGALCREAIGYWGGSAGIRLVEAYFDPVEFFACSPLAKLSDSSGSHVLKGIRVLDPLNWLLTGTRDRAVGHHAPK